MTNLFQRIQHEVETNPHGWATVQKAHVLAALIVSIRPKHILEVGIWSGKSLIPMAMALKHNGFGSIVGIDPWKKEASAEGMDGENLKWWSEVDHEMIYQLFLHRVGNAGVGDACVIHRCKSNEYPTDKIPELDLCHIDGNHGEEASCFDIETFGSRVRSGGFLFADDIQWASKATEKLSELGFVELYKLDTGALYQRTK